MTKKWGEVAASEGFKALSTDQQDDARRQYFEEVVAPRVPKEHRDLAWSEFSADVKPSPVEAGREVTVPTVNSTEPQAVPKPVAQTRAQRIADMQAATDPSDPNYLPVTENAVRALQTDARGGMDAKRTRSSGRVLDANVPPISLKSAAQDVASGALQIGPTVVKGVGDITRLATGDRVGKGLSDFADRGTKAIQEVVGSDRATAQRTRFHQDMQDPALNAADIVAGNPGALSDQVLPTVGSMAIPVGAASAAGKLATVGKAAQLARVIDEGTVLARAARAREAGAVGATVAQNAGSTFSDIRDSGGELDAAYTGAAITAPATYVASRLTGGGAEAKAAHLLAGGAKGTVKAMPKTMLKEGAQEAGEEAGSYAGETVGKGEEFNANTAGKRLAVAGTLGAVMGGGVEGAGALRETRIKTLRDAGETAAADLLQQKHDKQTTIETVDSEIAKLQGNDDFAQQYRELRVNGMKPAESAARSAVTVTYKGIALDNGVPEKAMAAALEATKDMPLDKVPGFLHKFTDSLAKRGLVVPNEAMAEIGPSLEAARDDAMDAAVDFVYQPVKPVMDDVLALEVQQNQPEPDAEPAVIEAMAAPAQAVDAAAHDAATSPLNDLPEPTNAQKEAGNYKVGRINLHGLNISIENPEGSIRKGTSPDGTKWENTLAAHYGYIRGTEGNDSDHVDTFIGPNPESQKVFVVDQVNKDGSFDEHKVMLGTDSLEQADELYHANYQQGWTGRGAITEMPMADFKKWVKDGTKNQPVGETAALDTGAAPVDGAPEVQPATSGDAPKADVPVYLGRNNTLLTEGGKAFKTRKAADDARKLNTGMRVVRAEGGHALTEKTPAQIAAQEAAAKRLRQPRTSPKGEPIPAHAMIAAEGGMSKAAQQDMGIGDNPKVGNRRLFAATGGMTIEQATERLVEDGYLQEGASHSQALELIKRSLTKPQYTPEGTERMAAAEMEQRQQEEQAAYDDAVAEYEDASDAQFQEVDDSDIPWDTPSNISTESAMRALGFDEQEIQDAIANKSAIQGQDSQDGGQADEGAIGQEAADPGQRASPQGEDSSSRSDPRRQEAQVEPQQTPAPAGVSTSGFTTELRPSGTLAIKGDHTAIIAKLNAGGVTKTMVMNGGIMVGKPQAKLAQDIIDGKPAEKEAPQGLSIGMLPSSAEPITVKNGIVYVGKYEALNFDSGQPVKVPPGATDAQVVAALKDAGAIGRRQRIFGLEESAGTPLEKENKSPFLGAEKPTALIELRKRASVLKALRKCMEA